MVLPWLMNKIDLDPRLPVVSVEDPSIPRCVATYDEAIAVIREHHGRWWSAQNRPAPPTT